MTEALSDHLCMDCNRSRPCDGSCTPATWARLIRCQSCFDKSMGIERKPCQAPADGSPCDESAQADKRYCTRHLAQIQKLADAGRLP